jgi:hypothetical protein
MTQEQPLNWPRVADRLRKYINTTGPKQFDSVFELLDYLDELDANTENA